MYAQYILSSFDSQPYYIVTGAMRVSLPNLSSLFKILYRSVYIFIETKYQKLVLFFSVILI